MQIVIHARGIEDQDYWRGYITERLEKIRGFFDSVLDVSVILASERHLWVADITVQVEGVVLHGEETSDDLRKSIDTVCDKMERQLRRHSGKLRARRRKSAKAGEKPLEMKVDLLDAGQVEAADDTRQPEVIRTRRVMVKPMSVDEAAMQMDLIDQQFMVFMNDVTGRINVLYRRQDGNYGLIEPEY